MTLATRRLILNKEASAHMVGTPRNQQNLKLGSGYTHPPQIPIVQTNPGPA